MSDIDIILGSEAKLTAPIFAAAGASQAGVEVEGVGVAEEAGEEAEVLQGSKQTIDSQLYIHWCPIGREIDHRTFK